MTNPKGIQFKGVCPRWESGLIQEKWEIEWEINNLRTEIRKDMRDYQLLYSEDRKGDYHFSHTGEVYWFLFYLGSQINNNISKLKELVEQNND